jgi:hypothetical protein
MYDREAVESAATDIALWEHAALELPLAEVRAVLADFQHDLAERLNTFNDIYLNDAGHEASTDSLQLAISEIARHSTATAIFSIALCVRTHLAAHQN